MKIITCQEWGARKAKQPTVPAGAPNKIIIHHTAGHAPGHGVDDAKTYARSIQGYHMDSNGWNDSGHNFLICRNGAVLEGRHGSVDAIAGGRMVLSAHCPGQNDQPGLEHEHVAGEQMTAVQEQASIELCTWICKQTGIDPSAMFAHRQYVATQCPDNLVAWIPELRRRVAAAVKPADPADDHAAELLWRLWRFGEGQYEQYGPANPAKRPKTLPNPAPPEWKDRAITFLLKRH